jgi:hypothetical protein
MVQVNSAESSTAPASVRRDPDDLPQRLPRSVGLRLDVAASPVGAVASVRQFRIPLRFTARTVDNVPPLRSPVVTQPTAEVRRAIPVETRRALPVAPRAELVGAPVAVEPQTGDWRNVTLLDGRTTVPACYQGELPSSAALPAQGRFIGKQWATGNTSWIWMTPAGASFPSWVDP